ncbi:hypothetical protein ACHAWF_011387 [Thalassiosira exigua]
MGDAARDRMIREISSAALPADAADDDDGERVGAVGTSSSSSSSDASSKSVLCRGCDPAMARRATATLPPLLGNVRMVAATDDDAFLERLVTEKFDVVFFAPGACRFDAARRSIPGGNERTEGWDLERYRRAVREMQGEGVPIVETTEERRIVPLLREALGLK